MIEYFIKLNKYQKGIIISLLILSLSLIGFMFNSRVRLGKPTIEIPDIIIEDLEDTDDIDSNELVEFLFMLLMYSPIIYLIMKGLDKII